jgi:hypothetical protein
MGSFSVAKFVRGGSTGGRLNCPRKRSSSGFGVRAGSARISRERSEGMGLIALESSPVPEFHLTVTPKPSESPAAMVRRLAGIINPLETTVVR